MGLTDTAVVKGALELMVDARWLWAQIEKTGGRPIERYTINPKAK